MKIHTAQVPPEGMTLTGDEPASNLLIDEKTLKVEEPVHYELFVQVDGTSLVVTGTLEACVKVECGRCLEWIDYDVVINDFATEKEITTEAADLTPELREDILLSLPLHPKCELTAKGKCSIDEKRWKAKLSASPQMQPGQQDKTVWEALDQLKKKSKQ